MAFITKGMGTGEISISLRQAGVPRDKYDDVVAQIMRLKQVKSVKSDGREGFIKVEADLGNLTGIKLSDSLRKLNGRITTIATNVAERAAAPTH